MRVVVRGLPVPVMMAAIASAVMAQEGIESDEEGTFSATVKGRPIADTLHSKRENLEWIQRMGRERNVCSGHLVNLESSFGTPRIPDRPYRRYYFAGGKLVRMTISDGVHADTLWSASVRSWSDAETRLLRDAARCMKTAKKPVDPDQTDWDRATCKDDE
jgi:methionine aminopeptidase